MRERHMRPIQEELFPDQEAHMGEQDAETEVLEVDRLHGRVEIGAEGFVLTFYRKGNEVQLGSIQGALREQDVPKAVRDKAYRRASAILRTEQRAA